MNVISTVRIFGSFILDGCIHKSSACNHIVRHRLTLHFYLPFIFQRLNSEVTHLREAQNIICTFIHFLFIGDPDLAKVVFWQVSSLLKKSNPFNTSDVFLIPST